MKTALLYEEHDLRTFALVLETGDEPRYLYRHHDPASGLALIDPFVNR